MMSRRAEHSEHILAALFLTVVERNGPKAQRAIRAIRTSVERRPLLLGEGSAIEVANLLREIRADIDVILKALDVREAEPEQVGASRWRRIEVT